MFERFTDRARRVLVLAQEEGRHLGHGFVGTEHLLLGLIREEEGIAAKALESLGITLEAARTKVEEVVGRSVNAPSGSPPFTPRAKKVLELALREALQLGHSGVGTEHMLLGIVREGEGVAAQVLVGLGADLGRVRQQVIQLMSGHQGKEETGENAPEVRALGMDEWLGSGARSEPPGPGKRPRPVRPGPPRDQRCILCDRDLWEVEHFVAQGPFHRVCDDCVRTAGMLLDQATPERRELIMPPRVSGHPPDDQAVAAIVSALTVAISASTDPESRAAVVEGYAELQPLYRRYAERLGAGPHATTINRLRFLTADLAEVMFEIMWTNGAMASFEGRVRQREGHWMVTEDTVASVLVPRGMRLPPGTAE